MKKNSNCGTLSTSWGEGRALSIKKCIGLLTGLLFMTLPVPGLFAGDFQIQPTSLTMNANEKSGVFSVVNTGNEKIDFQVDAKEWTQDSKGKDVYADTKEVIFFPKIMTVEAHEQRAIRIGIKVPPSQKEKTFRLFVEEIPTPKKDTEMQQIGKIRAGLTIAFRFATPIFVRPLKPQESAVVEKIEMSKGVVKAVVKNTGNVHIKLSNVTFRGIAADGKELFTKEIAGWYILNGISVPYEAAVPKESCEGLVKIETQAKSESLTINGTMSVQKKMCIQ